MKKIKMLRGCVATAAVFSFLFLAACSGDSSTSSDDFSDSSSSVIPGIDPESSSGSAQSSSSKDELKSSSSGKDESSSSSRHSPLDGESSSSSIGEVVSSSSSVEQNCSAFLDGETGWSWNVPKECRFNPDIDYGTMTDPRDNKVYKTIKIGDQVWMAENLNYSDSVKTPILLKRCWCYNNRTENCAVAGRFYTWVAAIDSVALYDGGNGVDCGYGKTCTLPTKVQGICPDGWHLPTETEWESLFKAVGGSSTAGSELKSTSGWNGGNGKDAFGFSALPTGYRGYYGDYSFEGGGAYFWSSTEIESGNANGISLRYDEGSAGLNSSTNKDLGRSVRCLQD